MKKTKTLSKIMAMLVVLTMVFATLISPVSAYYSYSDPYGNNNNYYYNDSYYDNNATTYSGYYPDYSGNGSYYNSSNSYYNYNSSYNTSYYGYYGNNGYYDYYGNYYNNMAYQADTWFENQYGDRFKFQWIKNPQAYAIREDYFRATFDMQMSYNNNSYSYATGNPQKFADYFKYSNYNRMIAILNGTGGGYSNNNILDGRQVNGQAYLDFDACITRAEAAKLCIRSNDAWWGLSNIRNTMYFTDMTQKNHWAKDDAARAYAIGIVNGVGNNCFNPDSPLTNQEMLTVFCNVVDRSYKYSIQNFIDMVNASDVARITEVYWNNNTDTSKWSFTKDTVYVNENDTFELKSAMSGWNNTITFKSSNTSVVTVASNGVVTPRGTGTATITATDSYGVTDSITIIVSSSGSNRPVQTPSPTGNMYFTQSSITIQRGNSINLANYIANASGSVTYYSNSNNIVTVSGATATGIAVGSTVVTASDSYGNTATVTIQVVDNNVSTNMKISVEFADNNTAGNLNFIVRGIDSSCTVKVNDNSNYSLVEQYREATWGKYAVQGLYPAGGTDTIVVCVYRGGQKIYESDPYVFYTGD